MGNRRSIPLFLEAFIPLITDSFFGRSGGSRVLMQFELVLIETAVL
jgi:hypothetical protein